MKGQWAQTKIGLNVWDMTKKWKKGEKNKSGKDVVMPNVMAPWDKKFGIKISNFVKQCRIDCGEKDLFLLSNERSTSSD
jgi:hypothetical protein